MKSNYLMGMLCIGAYVILVMSACNDDFLGRGSDNEPAIPPLEKTISYNGLIHVSKGNVGLRIEETSLGVYGLGNSLDDAVAIELPNYASLDTIEWSIAFADPYLSKYNSTGQSESNPKRIVTYRNESGDIIRKNSIEKIGDTRVIELHYPANTSVGIELYKDGTLVESFQKLDNLQRFELIDKTNVINSIQEKSGRVCCGAGNLWWCADWANSFSISIPSVGEFEDIHQYKIIYTDDKYHKITTAEIATVSIPKLTILDENVQIR